MRRKVLYLVGLLLGHRHPCFLTCHPYLLPHPFTLLAMTYSMRIVSEPGILKSL
jgi:hypothetical protein